MAHYGAQTHQQTMPYHQMQYPGRLNNLAMANTQQHNRSMNMAGQMNMMDRNLPYQNGPVVVNGSTGTGPSGGGKTLELKVVTKDMTPRSSQKHSGHLYTNMAQFFVTLPSEEAALLEMVEVFCFQYRNKLPYEPNVMPNASLYYFRLQSMQSSFAKRMEDVIGFRCCGCRHTAMAAGNPGNYTVGAAQLVTSQLFMPHAVKQSLVQLREHILKCQHVSNEIKSGLSKPLGACGRRGQSSLEQYLLAWMNGIILFAGTRGYPMIKPNISMGNNSLRNVVNPSVIHMQRTHLQQHGNRVAGYNNSAQSPFREVAPPPTEDVVHWELEDCVLQGLIENNFGVPRVKPRIVAAKLSELPISAPHEVFPFLELLLQSLCAMQRWRSPPPPPAAHAGTKRSNQEMSSKPAPALSNVFFQCSYCSSNAFCASTATDRDAAEFIITSACKHLCEDCDKVPVAVQEKLVKMREMITAEKRFKQRRIIEENFKSWKSQFPGSAGGGKKRSVRRLVQSKYWRPLSWKFLGDNSAACIADASLAHRDASVFLAAEDKKLPFATRDDDVYFGWNGKHLGNRRLLDLLAEARPAIYAQPLTAEQESIIACEVMREIGRRGGRFYSVASNPIMPPTLISPEKTVRLVLQTIKRGNIVLYQTPTDPLKRGRGINVIECESAPQRSLFGKDIVLNKRFKKSLPEE